MKINIPTEVAFVMGRNLTASELRKVRSLMSIGYANPIDIAREIGE